LIFEHEARTEALITQRGAEGPDALQNALKASIVASDLEMQSLAAVKPINRFS
jgi:hypothetical protein